MPLGRGLESLIPPSKGDNDQQSSPNEPGNSFRTEHSAGSPGPVPSEPRDKKTARLEPGYSGSGRKMSSGEAIFHIEVSKIKPNPHQPRRDFDEESLKELAASIREFGVIQPLVVSKIEKETEYGTDVEYQLIAGERRLRAVQMLGWERVPAIVKKLSSHSERLELAVIENLQRENLNPIETARAYAKLQDEFNLTQREIASRLGKSRETIANTLRLLNLPMEIQDALTKNQINESQARLLLAIPDLNEQQTIFKDLLNNNLSVRELKSKLRKSKKTGEAKELGATRVDPEIDIFEEELTELLGAKVKIVLESGPGQEKNRTGGKIIIPFYSAEEIQGLVEKINRKPKSERAI